MSDRNDRLSDEALEFDVDESELEEIAALGDVDAHDCADGHRDLESGLDLWRKGKIKRAVHFFRRAEKLLGFRPPEIMDFVLLYPDEYLTHDE